MDYTIYTIRNGVCQSEQCQESMATLEGNRDDSAATFVPFNLIQVIGSRFTRVNTSTYYDIDPNDLNFAPELRVLKETVGIHQYILVFSQKTSDANARKIEPGVHFVGRDKRNNVRNLRHERSGHRNGRKECLERGALGLE